MHPAPKLLSKGMTISRKVKFRTDVLVQCPHRVKTGSCESVSTFFLDGMAAHKVIISHFPTLSTLLLESKTKR
jgi:hypothetical protein